MMAEVHLRDSHTDEPPVRPHKHARSEIIRLTPESGGEVAATRKVSSCGGEVAATRPSIEGRWSPATFVEVDPTVPVESAVQRVPDAHFGRP